MNSRIQSRRLRRFFSSNALPGTGEEMILPVHESSNLRDVLRLGAGEHCLVTDGKGREAQAKILGFRTNGAARLVIEKVSMTENPQNHLVIRAFPALPQKGKMDDLIQKAQELGVDEILPVETRHTVIKIPQASWPRVQTRWNRIAQEAAKQSGALRLLQIHAPVSFERALRSIPEREQIAIFDPRDPAEPFGGWIRSLEFTLPVSLFWGPEGGFSAEELKLACSLRGASVVKLTDSILKVDTAFLGVISALRFVWN